MVVGDSLVVYNGDKQAITYVAKIDSVKKTKKHLRSKSRSVLGDHSDSASVVQLTWTKRIKIKKLNVMVRGSEKGRFPKDTVMLMTNNSKQFHFQCNHSLTLTNSFPNNFTFSPVTDTNLTTT